MHGRAYTHLRVHQNVGVSAGTGMLVASACVCMQVGDESAVPEDVRSSPEWRVLTISLPLPDTQLEDARGQLHEIIALLLLLLLFFLPAVPTLSLLIVLSR